ncbi:MAG: response regulator transcription factor [Calditrichota bacterium]
MNAHRILVIEDDPRIRSGLMDNLQFEGFQAAGAGSAESGGEAWREFKPDTVILDLMLPGRDGYHLLGKMRALGDTTPVIILSARGEEWDKLKGFRLGCDDYIVKPFSLLELIARIRVLLKRSQPSESNSEIIELPGLALNVVSQEARWGEHKAALQLKLCELLSYFMRHWGRVISRRELLDKIWLVGEDLSTRTVDAHVAALRRILEGSGYEIETVYKAGYRFQGIANPGVNTSVVTEN